MLAAAYLLPFSIRRAVWLVPDHVDEAWRAILFYAVVPFILLAPVNGALCRRWPSHRLLALAAVLNSFLACAGGVVAVTVATSAMGFWTPACLALGTAVFLSARDALLPEAAHEAQLPLSRVTVAAMRSSPAISAK